MAEEIKFEEMQENLNKMFLEVMAELIRLGKAKNEREFWSNLQVYAYVQKKYKIKNNLHYISAELLLRISAVYGVSVDYLFGRSEDMFLK